MTNEAGKNMKELMPCPFCGGAPLLSEGPYDWDCGGRYYYSASIECACGLTFEVDNPGPKVYTNDAEALNFAIDAWNTRAGRTCSPKFFDNLRETNGLGDAWAVCSECGWLLCVLTEKQEWPRYCPGCGAKVVEG